MRINVLLILLIFLLSSFVLADDFKNTYVQLLEEGKYDVLYQHLQKWEEAAPYAPELFIAYFNYYFNLGRNENMTIKKGIPEEESIIVLKDPDTGEEVGYLHSEIYYDEEKVDLGLKYLNEGLIRYPDRLDMHFGKIHTLGELTRYEDQKDAIIDVLNISKENNNEWLYHDGEKLDDAFTFMIDSIQGRLYNFINMGDRAADKYVIEISEKIIELYPDVVYPYNNIAVVYYYQNNYEEAIKYFKLAEEKNPLDTVVINNIAYLSQVIGDKETSLQYYEKLNKYGDEIDKELAEQKIKELSE